MINLAIRAVPKGAWALIAAALLLQVFGIVDVVTPVVTQIVMPFLDWLARLVVDQVLGGLIDTVTFWN